jgi:hypothetical protein
MVKEGVLGLSDVIFGLHQRTNRSWQGNYHLKGQWLLLTGSK